MHALVFQVQRDDIFNRTDKKKLRKILHYCFHCLLARGLFFTCWYHLQQSVQGVFFKNGKKKYTFMETELRTFFN